MSHISFATLSIFKGQKQWSRKHGHLFNFFLFYFLHHVVLFAIISLPFLVSLSRCVNEATVRRCRGPPGATARGVMERAAKRALHETKCAYGLRRETFVFPRDARVTILVPILATTAEGVQRSPIFTGYFVLCISTIRNKTNRKTVQLNEIKLFIPCV